MIDLTSHIEYLLLSHDCVMVPGLGAFLVHETPAHYDAESGRFIPPGRSLGFTQALTLNDGLLAESVARRNGVSLDEARAFVDANVSSFRRQLSESSMLPVGNLGVMSIDGESILFDPSDHSVVSLRYQGLSPVAIAPVVVDDVAHKGSETVVAGDDYVRPSSRPVFLKIAASLIMLMVGCGVYFTTDSLIESHDATRASLDSGLRSSMTAPAPRMQSAVVAESESLPVSRQIDLYISAPAPESATSVEVSSETKTPGRYLLVVASFPSMSSARKHIGDDASLDVIEMDGRFRVYAASASTISEANTLADSVRDKFPSVWICRR